jgi:3-hydroxyisobutyrate dehydrogenase-like beta-hydroxyacid dehydrogenase
MHHAIPFLGLGLMGAGIARRAVDTGHATTVWNRTTSKATPLAQAGAKIADGPAEAVLASPVSVICLEKYEHVFEVLKQVDGADALRGRTIVNVTGGTAAGARQMAEWVTARGADYLEGFLWDYPSRMTPDLTVVPYSGDRAVFDKFADTLSPFGRPVYEGSNYGLPNAMGLAGGGIFYQITLAAFYEALAYADSQGVAPEEAATFLNDVVVSLVQRSFQMGIEQIKNGNCETDQAANSVHYSGAVVTRDGMREAGLEGVLTEASCNLFEPYAKRIPNLSMASIFEEIRSGR